MLNNRRETHSWHAEWWCHVYLVVVWWRGWAGGDNQVPITTISVQVPCSCISMIFQFRCSGHNIAMCAFYLGNPSGTSRCMKLSTATTARQALLSTECIISAIALFLLVFKPAWACNRWQWILQTKSSGSICLPYSSRIHGTMACAENENTL